MTDYLVGRVLATDTYPVQPAPKAPGSIPDSCRKAVFAAGFCEGLRVFTPGPWEKLAFFRAAKQQSEPIELEVEVGELFRFGAGLVPGLILPKGVNQGPNVFKVFIQGLFLGCDWPNLML